MMGEKGIPSFIAAWKLEIRTQCIATHLEESRVSQERQSKTLSWCDGCCAKWHFQDTDGKHLVR